MRTITLEIIREHGFETRLAVQVDGCHVAGLAPEDIQPWLQGFIAALPPVEE